MDAGDKKKFMEIMTGLAENFSAQISTPGLRLRFDCLKEYDIGQIEAAAIQILQTRKTMGMPLVAEFLAVLGGCQKPSDVAEEQVNEVMRQIRQVGSYGTPDFKDPATKALLSSRWSFRSLCQMTEVELKWWAREFIEAYQSFERTNHPVMVEDSEDFRKIRMLTEGIGKIDGGKVHDRENQKKRLEQSAAYSCVPQ